MLKKFVYNGQETNYSISNEGKVFNDKTGRELKGTVSGNKEYREIQLYINGKPKTFKLHRLVALTFCENPNGYKIVDHIDRNKMNNKASNLRWVTVSDNNNNRKEGDYKREKKECPKEYFQREEWVPLKINNNYLLNKKGEILNKKSMTFLQGENRQGYKRVKINNKLYSLHRLIWESFNRPLLEKEQIDHIDGNKTNNCLSNLRVVNGSENMKNAYFNGHKGQISIKQYDLQGNFIKEYSSIQEAADAVKVTNNAVVSAAERRGSCGKYFWIREDQNFSIKDLLKNNKTMSKNKNSISVSQYDKDMNFIKKYDSIREAARSIGCSDSTIKRAADNERIGKGFYWKINDSSL